MSRNVTTGSEDQSVRFWAYDSAGSAVAGESHDSAGMAVSVVVRSAGRIVSTTALTLVARSGVGVHTDSALTEVGGGEYVVDIPDSYSATAGRDISLTVNSAAITGAVLVETLAVGQGVSEILAAVSAANVKLDAIGLKVALITAGRIRVLSRVVGATLTAKAGDDHLADAGNALTLEVDDDDAALFSLLTDAANLAVEFGAGRGELADEITVTLTDDNVSHVGTQTFVEIPLLAADTSGKRSGEYAFDIQITNADGYKITPQALEGVLVLTPDRKS